MSKYYYCHSDTCKHFRNDNCVMAHKLEGIYGQNVNDKSCDHYKRSADDVEMRYLVIVEWFNRSIPNTNCIVADSPEEANDWITEEMKGKIYSGTGIHKIIPVRYHKGPGK